MKNGLRSRWQALGSPAPVDLKDAWRQLHWASQGLAAFAAATLDPRPDDSHLSLGWDPAHSALTTHLAKERFRAGLRLADLTLLMLDGEAPREEHRLDRRTLREALDWIQAAAGRAQAATAEATLTLREWDMPAHAVGEGGRFHYDTPAAFAEVGRWYANADLVLGALARSTEGASAVRCWPHHFDLATLVTLDPEAAPGDARSVGIGLAPADASIDEPYLYANPWPRPDAPEPAALSGGGEWHDAGWFGATLRASVLIATEPSAQQRQVEDFLASALSADRALLGR